MTLDTLREMSERELDGDELKEARSTVRRYLKDYDRRAGLETHVTSDSLKANFSPTYRENMFEAFTLYREHGRDDDLRDAILGIGGERPLEDYLED